MPQWFVTGCEKRLIVLFHGEIVAARQMKQSKGSQQLFEQVKDERENFVSVDLRSLKTTDQNDVALAIQRGREKAADKYLFTFG